MPDPCVLMLSVSVAGILNDTIPREAIQHASNGEIPRIFVPVGFADQMPDSCTLTLAYCSLYTHFAREPEPQSGMGEKANDASASPAALKSSRGPRDSGKGVRVQGGKVYDSATGVTCHWCR